MKSDHPPCGTATVYRSQALICCQARCSIDIEEILHMQSGIGHRFHDNHG